MAWYDDITSGGLSGLLGTDEPNYLDQMFPKDADRIRNKAIQQGLIGGIGAYLRAPKNQNRGVGALVGDVLGGYQQGSQAMYNKQVSDYVTGQKLSELQLERTNREKLKEAIGKYNEMPMTVKPEERAAFYTQNVIPYLPMDKQAEALLPKITQKEVGDKLISYDQYGREVGRENVGMTAYQRQILSQGRIPVGYVMKADGTLEPLVGGPADVKAQIKEQGAKDFDTQVTNLRSYYRDLGKIGGITSTSNSAIKNLAASAASSDVGQMFGKALGTDAQSLRNTIEQSRPALLNAIKQATGMSAKQMDSNAELQLYLRSATDPKLDIETNLRALDNIQELYGSGKLQAIGATNKRNLTEEYKAKQDKTNQAQPDQSKPSTKQIVKTGIDKKTGKKVVQYSDGTISYGN